MGQASSRGTPSDSRSQPRVRPASWAPSLTLSPQADTDAGPELLQASRTPLSRPISQRFNPFNVLARHPERLDAGPSVPEGAGQLARRPSRLRRARTSLTSIPGIFSRRPLGSTRDSAVPYASSSTTSFPSTSRSTLRHSASAPYDQSPFLPRVQVPELDLSFDDLTNHTNTEVPHSHLPRLLPSRSHSRPSSMIPSFRSDRGIRSMTSSLRRRRSPLRRDEDQAAMLSRLLSVAAAATAASLMGDDHRAVSEARSVAGDGEDGTFDSFLQALQNGRIASALRGSDNGDGAETPDGNTAPLNFFRMFRFGSSTGSRMNEGSRSGSRTSASRNNDNRSGEEEEGDGRMIPIIIVGIRSINPSNSAAQDDNIPPFLDALSGFPNAVGAPSENTMDGMLRQPHRFSHRRRASMGGLHNFPSNYDSQRHYRSPDRPRPWSTLADSPAGPLPPPSTPASAGLSAVSSGTTTPTFSTSPPSPIVQSTAPSRRGSFIRRATGSNLEPTVEEPHMPQRTPRQRRLSESDFTRYGAGASRRNGVVEPDHNPGEGSRSWIIYVLGGSYPENHPILTTPSLFTDSPTYEDMILLSSLLGPAKPPVASEDDVAAAPGLFMIRERSDNLVAEAVDGPEVITLASDARCLVCLCDFEVDEEARNLVKCGHMFHRLCIDEWLTTGRNSCPLCRGQGVDEKAADVGQPSPPDVADVLNSQAAAE